MNLLRPLIAALCTALMLIAGTTSAHAAVPRHETTYREGDGVAPSFVDGGVTTAIAPGRTPTNVARSEVGWGTHYAGDRVVANMRVTTNLGSTSGSYVIVAQGHGPRGSATNRIWGWPAWSVQVKRGRWHLATGDPALGTEAWVDLGPYTDGATLNLRIEVVYAHSNRGSINVYANNRHVGGRSNVTTIQRDHYAGLAFRTGAYTRPLSGPMPTWRRTVRVHDLSIARSRV